jgi:hypothetical protein
MAAVNGNMLAAPSLGLGQAGGQGPNVTIREINASHADFILDNVDLRCVVFLTVLQTRCAVL